MKRFTFFLTIFLSLSLPTLALDWNWKNEDCADIGDWVNQDRGSGTSTQEIFDDKSCFKFNTPMGDNVNDPVRAIVDAGSLGDKASWTVEFSFYAQTFPQVTGSLFQVQLRDAHDDGGNNPYHWFLSMQYNRVGVGDNNDNYVFADFNLKEDTWYDVRWVSESGYQSLWVNNRLYLYKIYRAYQIFNYTNNSIHLLIRDSLSGDRTTYIDYFRVHTSAEHLTGSSLQIGSEDIVVRYRQNTDDPAYPNGVEALRMYGPTRYGGDEQVLSIPLVDIDHECASKVRLYDGDNVKSLMKLPEHGVDAAINATYSKEKGDDNHEGKTDIVDTTGNLGIDRKILRGRTSCHELSGEGYR